MVSAHTHCQQLLASLCLGLLCWSTAGVSAAAFGSTSIAVQPVSTSDLASKCDGDSSRRARSIFTEFVLEPHGIRLDQLPVTCPFHPNTDIFADFEHHRVSKNAVQKQCLYCKKVFKTDMHLDKHMHKKHVDRIPVSATACLADQCDILHCDWFADIFASRGGAGKRRRQTPVPQNSMLRDVHCMPQEAARTRHACQDLAHHCFPIEVAGANTHHHGRGDLHRHKWDAVHDYMVHTFCQAATCAPGARDKLLKTALSRSGRRHMTTLTIVGLVIVAMAAAVGVLCCVAERAMPKHPSQAPAPTARSAQRPGKVVDPSGKLGRKPQPPPPSQASGLNQVPYVARRPRAPSATPGIADTVAQTVTAWSAGGQQMVSDAMQTIATTIGVQPATSLAPQTSLSSPMSTPVGAMPPMPPPPPQVAAQVVHAGSVPSHPGVLHQRGHAGGNVAQGRQYSTQQYGGLETSNSLRSQSSGGLQGPTYSQSYAYPQQQPSYAGTGQYASQYAPQPPHGAAPPPMSPPSTPGPAGWLPAAAAGMPLMGSGWGRQAPPRPPDKAE